jgi:hypothetical protein
MVRAVALSGLALLFLTISPNFRLTLWGIFAALVGGMEQYSPLSYVAMGCAIVLGFLFALRAASAPRKS